jgi:hypothetical protein
MGYFDREEDALDRDDFEETEAKEEESCNGCYFAEDTGCGMPHWWNIRCTEGLIWRKKDQ